MGDLSTEGAVVHEKDFKILGVVDDELFESVGKIVFGGVVRTVADFWHFLVASESSTHAVINAWISLELPLGLLQLSASLPP